MRPSLLLASALLPFSSFAADPPPASYGFAEAQKTISTMTAAEGLQASLFASEPQIQNPTNIDIDPRGRVWAVEAVNYRTTMRPWGMLRPEGDRVVILEDTDHDGIEDKETTFWQSPELKAPLGICVLPQKKGTKVIVSAAPNVWLLTDADGDDKAEKVEKLFTVGGNWDHDHQVHAFSYGLDGRFYFNMGNEAKTLMDPNGKTIIDLAGREVNANGHPYRQGMVFRCDIDLEKGVASNVETMAWNFRNNYEVAIDSFGTLWQSDNDDDGNKGVRINYVMQYGNYGYSDEMTGAAWQAPRTNIETEVPKMHWHQNDPGSIPNLLQTGGGSPTGILVNEGALLGKRFENQMIHCDAGPRVVRAYPVTNDGAGYKAEMVDILTSSDPWYRPSDVAIAPDGSLFIADWYDPGVGGHNMGDHDAKTIRGRLYRVAPKDSKFTVLAPDFSTPEGCVAALKSPNRSTQYVAAQALHAMAGQAQTALTALSKDANPRLRARAFAVLAQQPSVAVETLQRALADTDSDVRVAAIRLSATLAKYHALDTSALENSATAQRLLQDKSPQVRREIALSLYNAKQIEPLWAALARQYDGKDRWYLEALGIGAAGNDEACFNAWLAAIGGETGPWNNAAGRDIIWRLRSPKIAPYLGRIVADPTLDAADVPRFLRAFDFIPASDEKTKALTQLARLGDRKMIATEALQRLKGADLAQNPELKTAVLDALKAMRGTPQFVELVRDFKLQDQTEGLLEIAVARPDSPEGVEATKVMLDTHADVEKMDPAGHINLIRALGNTADARGVNFLSGVAFNSAKTDFALRQQAVRSLTKSSAGIDELLKVARGRRFPDDLRETAVSALSMVQLPKYKDEIAQFFPNPNAAVGGPGLPPISELVKLNGKVDHGKAVFAAQQSLCTTCHRVGQLGVDFGPALSEIGTKLGKAAIYESIIDPNAGVSMGFETTVLTMKDNSSAVGIIRSETADEVVLATPGGILVRNQKADIAKREKLPTSMMPPVAQILPQQDLVDLVEYLATLKAPAK